MLKIFSHHLHPPKEENKYQLTFLFLIVCLSMFILQKIRCEMFKMWGSSATKRGSDESPITCVSPTVLCLCGLLSTISEGC